MIATEKILVLAPHPDDEVIGCGAYLKRCTDAGFAVKVLVITDGAAGALGIDPEVRKAESRAALASLGIRDCEFLGYPDGRLPLGGSIVESYRSTVRKFRPSRILLPHPAESHSDHRILTRGALIALEGQWQGSLWFYETTSPCQPINHVEEADGTLAAKVAALAAYSTQLAQFDYVTHCTHLARLRGLSVNHEYAEAFLSYDWDGKPQAFFPAEPLVSVIVRASDPLLVMHALRSIADQTYAWIEVVLVWFGGAQPPDTDSLGLPVTLVHGTANRGSNLNAGAAASRGELVGFLDEDDVLYVGHVAALVEELVSAPDLDVAFVGCRVVACVRNGDDVTVTEDVEQIDNRYEPGRLLLGNYITLHSVLVRRNVLRTLRFEPTLEAYEDWDFFAHAEQRDFRFGRVPGLLCEYRLYPQDGEERSIAAAHARRGYGAWRDVVRSRIGGRFSARDFERLEAFASRLEGPLREARRERDEHTSELVRVLGELNQYRAETQWVKAALDAGTAGVSPDGTTIASMLGRNLAGPVISVIVPVHDTAPDLLRAMLTSVVEQSYTRWQLCIVDDASTRPDTHQVLDEFAGAHAGDARILIRRRDHNGGIVMATNEALTAASGDYVAFVDHDDILDRDAMLHVALGTLRCPGARLLYTDNRMIDHAGNVLNVFRKPDWSPTTLLSYNYVNHLAVVKRDLLETCGRFRTAYGGAQDWDLLLRLRGVLRDEDVVHIRHPVYDWRATNTSVAYSSLAKPWAVEAARRTVSDAVAEIVARPVTVEANSHGVGFVVTWDPEIQPVTAVIPTHSNHGGLGQCLRGLLEETDFPDLRVIVVANRCTDPLMRATLDSAGRDPRVVIAEDSGEFNWAALMNRALRHVATECVLFLNDDVEILHPEWMRCMQRLLLLPGVGAVGATLFFPNGGLQHAGVETNTDWIAGNVARALLPQEAIASRDVSAVTGACMLTTRRALARVGGLDESLPIHYNDVDYCLALRQAGLRIVQTYEARLLHHESATRGRPERVDDPVWNEAVDRMRSKWGSFLEERYRTTFRSDAATRMLTAR